MDNRRALVTGGASGFGLETARALLAQGAQVAVADITADTLHAAALDVALDVTASTLALVVDAPNTSARRRAISSSLAGAHGFMVARSTRATTCADERDR